MTVIPVPVNIMACAKMARTRSLVSARRAILVIPVKLVSLAQYLDNCM